MPLALETSPALETSRPHLDELPKEAMRRTIRDLLESPEPLADVEAVFDVPVIARRCLGRHWPTQSPAERTEFVDALAGLLVDTLRDTLGAASRIRYTTQCASGPLVTVKAELSRDGGAPAALELRVHRVRGRACDRQGHRERRKDSNDEAAGLMPSWSSVLAFCLV